jgi:predicted alpha/beta superfamily hydrolase
LQSYFTINLTNHSGDFSPGTLTIIMKKIILIFSVLLTQMTFGQHPRVTIEGSQIRKITSKIVSGQEYELQILLPAGYEKSNKKYPVAYLMDSQWDLPMISSIYGQQYFDGFIPELIIVGITWGGTNPKPNILRARDYTPTKVGSGGESGGADKFLDFIKTEAFPFMESQYRVDNNNKTLMGCSLGGLFTMYTLFTRPEMFNNYIAASPAFGWDNEVLYSFEKAYFENKKAPAAKLYMTVGDVERNVSDFEMLSSFMKGRKYSSLHVQAKILENTGHSGTKSETYTRGLQYVFEKANLRLNADLLKKYAGTYQTKKGFKVELQQKNNQLILLVDNNTITLRAASNTSFYSRSEFVTVDFDDKNAGTVTINSYGNSDVLTKI